MKAVAAHELLIIIGDEDSLPWVDGARYLGRDPQAPALLLPTAREPNIPISLFEKALLQSAGALPRPIAVFEIPPGIASLAEAAMVTSDAVKFWLLENHR
jgi:hypothetical protein